MDILIISGLSGSGKSRVAAVLEDFDYYCVDNMPVTLMPKFAELCLSMKNIYKNVALVTDVRSWKNYQELFSAMDEIKAMGIGQKILFIEADIATIVKRYKETRRRHPLDPDGKDIENAVMREINMLKDLREHADYIIDTSKLTLGQLQRKLFGMFCQNNSAQIKVNLVSFGYKNGIPLDADLVFDARFLPNPYYIPELQYQTGLNDMVRDYVFSFELTDEYVKKILDMLMFLIPHFIAEGKSYASVCIGCTGGRHRSVALVEKLAAELKASGYDSEAIHRDINR